VARSIFAAILTVFYVIDTPVKQRERMKKLCTQPPDIKHFSWGKKEYLIKLSHVTNVICDFGKTNQQGQKFG
jgi:hypothetical protein